MSELPSFQELLRRVRAGDPEAASQLVHSYEAPIRRAVRFRLGDTPMRRVFDSADICQSVLASFFVRAAAGQYDLDTPDQLQRLLVAMARNKLHCEMRRQTAQRRDNRRIADGALEDDLIASPGPTPSGFVAGRELLEQAEQLLSEEERQLIEMRRQGLEWTEIAAQLGGSPEALRKKLARATERVARELQLDEFSDDE